MHTHTQVDVLMELVEFIVANTFVANYAICIRRQKIGLPMGTSCAPEIANLDQYREIRIHG